MQLFVYGGLLKGMTLSPFIEGSEYLGPAFIKAELYFLGQFPGIIEGNGIVFGELYEVSEEMIPKVDKIEHYHVDDPGHSSYIRKELEVTCLPNKEKLKADAYFYNRSVDGQEHIPYGDYRRFINEYDTQKFWVINSILGGKTNGFFHSLEQNIKPKKAMIETINGMKANGVHGNKKLEVKVVELQKEQIQELDKISNVPDKYFRVSIPFIDENGDTQMALTYYPNFKTL
jgi:gamma-glutamylcyclotransferase (GGCT)/AIG2-like uncharacterized protein YtfP